jgi:succinoglycan biosynthesis protein ExoL
VKKIAYFVHDLSDPAVRGRTRMFLAGGADVSLVGFRRGADSVGKIEGLSPLDLGRTLDAKLGRRVIQIARALLSFRQHLPAISEAEAFVARNLEMLIIAIRARAILKSKHPVTYECLDIHRQQISKRLSGRLIRRIESMLIVQSQLLLTSSPAFVTAYFDALHVKILTEIVENKVLDLDGIDAPLLTRADRHGPPWIIGWFGQLRCRKSFEILTSLAAQSGGFIKVVTAGRPAVAVFENFEALISKCPHVSFLGPYRNPEDLPDLYNQVHFSWTVDYFADGANSRWLLPNRLYESGLHGAVPIAIRDVETGEWLARRKLGALLSEPIERSLVDFFQSLTANSYNEQAAAIGRAPRPTWVHDLGYCQRLVELILNPREGDS